MIDMTNIYDVELKMVDELRGTEVVRVIDKGNAMTSGEVCWELRGEVDSRSWKRATGNPSPFGKLEIRLISNMNTSGMPRRY